MNYTCLILPGNVIVIGYLAEHYTQLTPAQNNGDSRKATTAVVRLLLYSAMHYCSSVGYHTNHRSSSVVGV